jgi:hypothetical protein
MMNPCLRLRTCLITMVRNCGGGHASIHNFADILHCAWVYVKYDDTCIIRVWRAVKRQ